MADNKPLLSIVIPLFNEEQNFPVLFEKLKQTAEALFDGADIEFVFVNDGSADRTFELLAAAAQEDKRVRALSFSRNFGSHAAVMAGVGKAKGDCVLFMAGDLQDPPSLIATMLDEWKKGFKMVWAARQYVERQAFKDRFFSLAYWGVYNLSVKMPVPKGGVDFGLMDRVIADQIKANPYSRLPVFVQAGDAGFPYAVVSYVKGARQSGKSGWTLKKKLALVFETLLVSSKPIGWLFLLAGAFLLAAGICFITRTNEAMDVGFIVFLVLAAFCLVAASLVRKQYKKLRHLEIIKCPRFEIAQTAGILD